MACPVTIHKVTDSSPYESGAQSRCPISTLDIDDITDSPTVQEYKRLRRVMGMITKFYRQGSDKKKDNWNIVTEEMSKVDLDLTMAQAQLDVLTQSAFKGHPKKSEYAKNLKAEIEALEKQKTTYLSQQKEFFELYEWSKGIVHVCEWLEMALDDYCSKKMELPENLLKHIKTPPELKPEEIEKFSKGLDEITYNLQESQDFFQASIDGRLVKYHDIEKKLIEEQLEILKKFPEDSPRRAYIEMELQKDLEYVQGNMNETPESMNRKQKMLTNHQEFFSVLRFIREKIHLLPAPVEKKYDSKYDHYQ